MNYIVRTEHIETGLTIRLTIDDYDTCIAHGKKNLERFRESGILKEGTFEDPCWVLDDGKGTARVSFQIDDSAYKAGAGTWSGVGKETFVSAGKAVTALQLGTLSLSSIQALGREFREVGILKAEELRQKQFSLQVISTLAVLPNEPPERTRLLEDLDCPVFRDGITKGPRALASLSTLLRYDTALQGFWETASDSEKVEAFPFWLNWNLTAILPLRPTEFLLLPRDCIHGEAGRCTLDVRRTKLKKHKGTVTYSVSGDYKICTYSIPDDLADSVLWYIRHSLPGSYGSEEYLLGNGTYLSYPAMRAGLRNFIETRLGLPELANEIRLGDTRHLAMIGLINSGGSPSLCKALADHDSINQSSYYYSNLPTLLKSSVLHYQLSGKDMNLAFSQARAVPEGVKTHAVPMGRCDAMEVADGDITECLRNCAPDHHLGDCCGCVHFYPDARHLTNVSINKSDTACFDRCLLIEMIEQLRSGRGASTRISQMLERLSKECSRSFAAAVEEDGGI